MNIIEVSNILSCEDGGYESSVLFGQGAVKVRRIELAAGACIPPCRMQEDVVFVVIEGRVAFVAESEKTVVSAPNAVFIPGGATTRSMAADEPSLVLAVLYKREATSPEREPSESKT